jgi:hypothetical protein
MEISGFHNVSCVDMFVGKESNNLLEGVQK